MDADESAAAKMRQLVEDALFVPNEASLALAHVVLTTRRWSDEFEVAAAGMLCWSDASSWFGFLPLIPKYRTDASSKRSARRICPPASTPRDLGWLPLWLRAHEIQDLVLARADLYPSEVDAALDALVRPAGVRLWVVVERAVADAAAPVLGVEEEQCWSWGRFRARWSHQDRRRDPEEAVAIDPPLDLAAVWGAEHERLLRATTGAMGTDPYAIGFWEATSWSNGQAPSAARTAGRLRGLLARFDDPVCLVQAARGADVGPRPYGWEVRLDIGRIAGGPPRTPGPREATIRLSHVELGRDPCSTAVVALAAQRLRIQEIIELRIGDFAADVSSVLRRGDLVPLPPRARPLVRAQILTRLDQSAGPLDHLIASSRAPTVESITKMILATQRAIGDSLLAHTLRALPGQDERWLNEHGIWLAYRRAQERPALRPEGMDPELFRSMLVEVLKGEPRAPSRCACATEHPVPDPSTIPAYPPPRNHASPPPNHPWHSNFKAARG